jgi:hypothetical protein
MMPSKLRMHTQTCITVDDTVVRVQLIAGATQTRELACVRVQTDGVTV